MSRRGSLVVGVLVVLALAGGAALWLRTFERVDRVQPLPPRGEAAYNPLYALKRALQADGQQVDSRQRLLPEHVRLGARDTVLVLADPRTLAPAELDALFALARRGGHVLLRAPPAGQPHARALAPLVPYLPVQPATLPPSCAGLALGERKPHREFCGGARFRLAPQALPSASWGDPDAGFVFARFPLGEGSVDLVSHLDFLGNGRLDQPGHAQLARRLLAPRYGQGRFHLVYAADMPPLWRWLLTHAWRAWLPLLLALAAWLWMRMHRFGPMAPAPDPPRRALLEHVQASARHLVRYGRLAVLQRAARDAALARLQRRDPLAASLEGDAQAAQLAPRLALPLADVIATLDTRPPRDLADLRLRVARLIALRNRL